MQGILDQALHAVDFTAQAFTQLLGIALPLAGHAQAAQRCTQFMGQVTQQLLLKRHGALQALGHVVERPAQFAQFVLAAGRAAGHPCRQLIGAPGIGLLAQLDQRHDQHAVQAHTEQQGEEPGNDAVGHDLPEQAVLPGEQALRQLDNQQPLLRVLQKRQAHPGQARHPSTHGPVDTAQKGHLAALFRRQRRAAQRLQIRADHRHPGRFLLGHGRQPLIHPRLTTPFPGLLGFGGVGGEGRPGLFG
ncbi:hypothetical protein D3C77_306010 [compost metagenome]